MKSHVVTVILAVIVAASASMSGAQAPQNLPPAVRAGHAQAVQDCRATGGRLSVGAGYISKADFNGDGMPDYIRDLSKLECSASASIFCGSHGCGRDIYVSRSNAFYPVTGIVVDSAKVVTRAGKTLLHVNEDDGAGGKYWGWNGSKIDLAGPSSRASAPSAAPGAAAQPARASARGRLPLPLGYYNARNAPCERETEFDALVRLTATGLDNAVDGGPEFVSIKQVAPGRYDVVERYSGNESEGVGNDRIRQTSIYEVLSPTSFRYRTLPQRGDPPGAGRPTTHYHCNQARVPARLRF